MKPGAQVSLTQCLECYEWFPIVRGINNLPVYGHEPGGAECRCNQEKQRAEVAEEAVRLLLEHVEIPDGICDEHCGSDYCDEYCGKDPYDCIMHWAEESLTRKDDGVNP